MRSRPDLTLFLEPRRPLPGTSFDAIARLVSRSETPVDAIEFLLVGSERRAVTHPAQKAGAQYAERRFLTLKAVSPSMTLSKGERRHRARFELPAGLPPAYTSPYASIEYALDVRVRIPWWPDRHERYRLPVVLPPVTLPEGRTQTFCTSGRGAQGTDLYIEASLSRTEHALGDDVHGAVSFSNVSHHRIRRIELSLVTMEIPRVKSSAGVVEVGRYAVQRSEAAPEDGKAIPFRIRLPANAPISFDSTMISVAWLFEVRAVIAFGSDVTLRVPLVVTERHAHGSEPAVAVPRVAPVGRERRALVWADVASRMHLENDAEAERMTAHVGPIAIAITLEQRGDAGLSHVATLRWARLGIALTLTERRWVDAFAGDVLAVAGPFGERFSVRSADRAQSSAVFDEDVRNSLLAFEEVAADDEGAVFASPGSAHSVTELSSFVEQVLAAARALAQGIARIPPPASMAPFVAAWIAFAERHEGRFEIGRVYVHDATVDRARVDVGTRHTNKRELEATLVRVHLPSPLPRALDAESDVSTDVRARIASLNGQCRALTVGPDAIEARLPAPLEDPEALVPLLESMAALGRALRGERDGGPYR